MTLRTDRRRLVLAATAFSVAGLAALLPKAASATPQAAAELLQKLAKGTPRPGRVTLQMPDIADNGSSVAMTVAVESPMTEADHVKAIHVVAEGNPNPGVISVRLGPHNGKAEVSVRIRLAASERVIAVAEMADGSLWSASRQVVVTVGGCGG
jgi:sulfur-oxidizing protein SoxY